jgi:hypothetical protein
LQGVPDVGSNNTQGVPAAVTLASNSDLVILAVRAFVQGCVPLVAPRC